jgi:mevalonate kinase
MIQFKANTKFLLTGEYALLQGADALVLPLAYTQRLNVKETVGNALEWESWERDKLWYANTFTINIDESYTTKLDKYLANLIHQINQINPDTKYLFRGKKMRVEADFNLQWGLGSSSTLISLLSQYTKVDAYILNSLISKGSGYDVVAATQDKSFVFTKTEKYYQTESADLNYSFKDKLYFVYTGRKQDTNESIRRFNVKQKRVIKSEIQDISKITKELIEVKSLSQFQYLISEHETIIAKITDQESLLKNFLPNFSGAAKSLGAWGGDFILITWKDSEQELQNYLKKQKIETYFPWKDIVL